MATKLRELQEKLQVKQDQMQRIFEQSRKSDGAYDFTQAEAFEHLDNQRACYEMLESMEKELDDLQSEVKTLETVKAQEDRLTERIKSRRQVDQPMQHTLAPNGHNGMQVVQKSLSDLVREVWPKGERPGSRQIWLEKEFSHFEIKTLMTTAAGWAPETTRVPRIAEFAHRPIQVTDLFPIGNTDQAAIAYMEETTSTNAATEVAEATIMPESALAFAERTVTIRKIATYIPVTDEQLADVNQVAGLIDARLRFFVQQRLDLQLLVGDGNAPNILGIVATPNVQTQAKGADPEADAIYKAMDKIRTTGRANPSAIVMHPNDWQTIRLMRSVNGDVYLWGAPTDVGVQRIWGVPVVVSDAMTENTALVGDFANFSQLWLRQGVEVLAGYINDDFIYGKQAIRATLRAALAVYRPQAFALVTGL
jgi:HK97 family phage major capsid protein